MSKQRIIYYIYQFLKASESFSLQKISMVFKRVSQTKTLTSFFRILITLLIYSYFYSFFSDGSQEFFIFSLGLSTPRISKNFAVQPQKLILSTITRFLLFSQVNKNLRLNLRFLFSKIFTILDNAG